MAFVPTAIPNVPSRFNNYSSPTTVQIETKVPKQEKNETYGPSAQRKDRLTIFEEPEQAREIVFDRDFYLPKLVDHYVSHRIEGVLDRPGDQNSQVTLTLRGKDTGFSFPTKILASSGVNYAGALFAIEINNADGFFSYNIIHRVDDETRARSEAAKLDLSFLDGIAVAATEAPRKTRKRK